MSLLTVVVGVIAFLFITYKICRKVFVEAPFTDLSVSLKGKSVFITGASDGIGQCTALNLAKMGADIIFACRNEKKTKIVMEEIQKEAPNSKLTFLKIDLSDLNSVVSSVENFKKLNLKIDILITNAGYLNVMSMKDLTKQGVEKMVGINHLSHYLLLRLLMKFMIESKGKIIILASHGHTFVKGETINIKDFFEPSKGTSIPLIQYGASKLFNVLTSSQIHKLYHKYGVRCNSLHPGNISTGIGKDEFGIVYKIVAPILEPTFFKTIFEGSQTTLYLASSIEVEEISGKYFQDNNLKEPNSLARNEKLANELWDYSEELCKVYLKNINFDY
eukprot:gene6092-10100_t